MPTKAEKERRKQIQEQLRAEATDAFLASLPVTPAVFRALFDWLDEKLGTTGCDKTLRLTEQFAAANEAPFMAMRAWLVEHGGYCDCEVLANVEDHFEALF